MVGEFTGSAEVKYATLVELEDLTKVGEAVDADVSLGKITFTDAPGRVAAVKDGALVISDRSASFETCEVCGSCQWIPVTQAELRAFGICEACGECRWHPVTQEELKAFGMSDMLPGHYLLTEDVKVDLKRLNENGDHPGSFCIDLAGHSYTGTTRPFAVFADASLNIFDSVGGGVITGNCGSAAYGGVLYLYPNSSAALYGGTLKHSATITNGGVVCVSGGSFCIHGGTIEGGSVTGDGGAIMISSKSGQGGVLNAAGGRVTTGTAGGAGACVYVNNGCAVNFSGNTQVDKIRFAGASEEALKIVGPFSGQTILQYSNTVTLVQGTVLGQLENAALYRGNITVANNPCAVATISGDALVINTKHNYERVTLEVTCTTDGSITDTCTVCGDIQVQSFPATGHSFTDGICTVCGEADPDYVKPVVIPTLTLKAPALEFKDMVKVIAFFTADNIDDVVEMGMVTYGSDVSEASVETADHVIPGAILDESSGRYFASSQGINAKYLGDTVYLACYAKLTDGSYVYTKVAPYGAVQYATNQLKNSTDMKLKQLVAAMLNYGAAAQNYFGYHTNALANASLTAEQLALPESYFDGMVSTVPAADAAKQGSFANNQGFSVRKPAVSFEGAFSINYFFTPAYTPVNGITLYYWNADDYNAASVLSAANASGSIRMTAEADGQYRGDITDIAAKNLAQAIYVAAVYSDGTTTRTSGVLGYSIGAYCASQATKGGTIAELAKATAVYGYHAKQYFG